MTKEFKITKEVYYSADGTQCTPSYHALQKKYFLGIPYWSMAKKTESGWGSGDYKTPLAFSTVEEAETFIKEVLCPKVPREKWVTTEVQRIERMC